MRRLRGVFANNEGKIIPYCIYHNADVNAVIDLKGNLEICDKDKKGETCSLFYLSEDKIDNGVIVKSMKMNEFIDLSREQNVDYIDLCNTTQCRVSRCKISHVDAYRKPVLDSLFRENRYAQDNYLYLGEDGLIAVQDGDEITVTLSTAILLGDSRVKDERKEILARAGVRSFDELYRYVELGKRPNI